MDLSEWTKTQRTWGFAICFSLGVTLMWIGSLEPPRAAQAASDQLDQPLEINVSSTPEPSVVTRPQRRPRRTIAPLSMQTHYHPAINAPEEEPEPAVAAKPPSPATVTEPEVEPPASEPIVSAVVEPVASTLQEPESAPTASDEPEVAATLPDLSKHRPERETYNGVEIPEDRLADGTWDTSAPGPPPERPKVTIDAGPDQVIWAGAGPVKLEAIATDGRIASFTWEQTSGPDVRLEPGGGGQVEISGFAENKPSWNDQMCAFDVEMVDANGKTQSDLVRVWVRWAPDLTLSAAPEDRPRSRRRFEEIDGLPIAQYECTVRPTDYPARFAIDSAGPLTFSAATSAAHEFVYSEIEGRHLYELSVYQSSEEPRTELVIYAQSADEIPAVIKAVVEWQ